MTNLCNKIFLDKHIEKKYFIENVPVIYPNKKVTQLFLKIHKNSQNYFGDCFVLKNNKNVLDINEIYNASLEDFYIRYFFIWFLKNNHPSPPIGDHNNVYRDQRKIILQNFVKNNCEKIKTVLDIGCDNIFKNENDYKADLIFGIDPYPNINASVKNFHMSKIKLSQINKIHAFAEFLPFKNEFFDLIVFDGSFDHLLDWKGSLNEANRCLTKNGKLIISVLNWNDNESLIQDIFHFHHFSSSEIIIYLKSKGFVLIEEKLTPWKNQNYRNVSNLIFSKN